jgi:hypothetical protein
MNLRRIIPGWCVAALIFAEPVPAVQSRELNVDQARTLVRALLKDGWAGLPGFKIVDYPNESRLDPWFPHYHVIHALYDNPGGSATVGHYAVDLATGEVWDWVGGIRYTSPALVLAQIQLRKQIGLRRTDSEKAEKVAPWCPQGSSPELLAIGHPRI